MPWRLGEARIRIQPSKDNIEQMINPHLGIKSLHNAHIRFWRSKHTDSPIPSTLIFGYFSVHINFSFHCNSSFHLDSGQLLSRTLARLPARPPENNEVVLSVCFFATNTVILMMRVVVVEVKSTKGDKRSNPGLLLQCERDGLPGKLRLAGDACINVF